MNEPGPHGNSGMPDGENPFRTEPDLERCRAKDAGFGNYVDCLTPCPERCLYSLVFGEGHLCLHPARHQIVSRTKSSSGAQA